MCFIEIFVKVVKGICKLKLDVVDSSCFIVVWYVKLW